MKKCSHCKSDMEEDSLFCTNCGKKLPHKKTCIHCGKKIDNDCDWCVYCGEKQMIVSGEKKETILSKKSNKVIIAISSMIAVCMISGGIIFFLKHNPTSSIIEDAAHPIVITDDNNELDTDSEREGTNDLLCPEPKCGGIIIENISVNASHTLKNQGSNSYHASNILDENNNTVWATHFTGDEEELTFFMNTNGLYKIFLINGYNKSSESFDNNSRAKDVRVYVNGVLAAKEELRGCYYHWPEYIVLDKQYDEVREVKIIISSVYEGNKWNDLCITNIAFYRKN